MARHAWSTAFVCAGAEAYSVDHAALGGEHPSLGHRVGLWADYNLVEIIVFKLLFP